MQQADEILTADALKITRVSQSHWRTSIDKALYVCAPPTVNGRREWNVDSLVCLAWYDSLVRVGMKRVIAGTMAAELNRAIARNPSTESFNVYAWGDREHSGLSVGNEPPDEAPSAQVIFVMPLATWRNNIRAAIVHYLQRRAERDANRRR